MKAEWIGLGGAIGILTVLVAGCAQVGSPGGGGRDETPPAVVSADPAFGTTNWSGSRLLLTFDEFVQVKDARNQVLVSPPLPAAPKVLVKGRSVLVDLGDGLTPDRTYVVQFGNAIQDLRESNVAAGLQHVFSTGSRLDSGRVAARVVDAWTGEPAAGARVMLYRDSLPEGIVNAALPDSLRPLPEYVGLVGDSGSVEIGFLPEGRFAMVALQDLNGNYRPDQGEAVAWWSEAVSSADTTAPLTVMKLDAPPVVPATYVSGMRVDSSGSWRAKLEGWADLQAGPDGWLDGELEVAIVGPGDSADSVFVHIEGDSLWAELPGFNADAPAGTWRLLHPGGMDSLRFRDIEGLSAPAVAERGPSAVPPGGSWSLRWAPAPDALDTALLSGTVIREGDTLDLSKAHLSLDVDRLRCVPLPEGARCDLELLPGAVARGAHANRDTVRLRWMTRTANDVGSLVLLGDSLDHDSHDPMLFVLTSSTGEPLYERSLDADGRFSLLEPGRYGLVMIADRDGNGRWTGVDPASMTEAEPVTVLSNDIEVRAGWEVELTLPVLPRP